MHNAYMALVSRQDPMSPLQTETVKVSSDLPPLEHLTYV